MKKVLLLWIVVLGSTVAHGQTIFQKTIGVPTYGEIGFAVNPTNDGGFIFSGGIFLNSTCGGDSYLVKFNSNGDTLWTSSFGGSSAEYGYDAVQTSDGGYICTGSTTSFGAGSLDVFLAKTDNNGNLLWLKSFGGTGQDQGYRVQQTNDGGYIIAGVTALGAGWDDYYLIKTDSSGNLLWEKTYGGSDIDQAWSVKQTTDGGYILAGGTNSYGNSMDILLIKTDSNGDTLWVKAYSGTNMEIGRDIYETPDGGYAVAGGTASFSAGIPNALLLKIDSLGNINWAKTYGGTNSDDASTVIQNNDGGFVLMGVTNSFGYGNYDMYMIKTDASGNLLWSKTYGGSEWDEMRGAGKASDGGYLMAGRSKSFGLGDFDIYLVKTDSIGNSGCYETSPSTNVSNGAFQIKKPTLAISSGNITGNYFSSVLRGGAFQTLCFTNDINDESPISGLKFSPNPFTTQTTLQTDIPFHNATLTVYNYFGKTVAQIKNISGQTITFNRGNLASGLYFIFLAQDGKTYSAGKVVIVDK